MLRSRDQLGGDVERVGDDGEPAPVGQRAGDLGGRRTPGHPDHVAVVHEAGRGQADGSLLAVLSRGLVLDRQLEAGRTRQRAAVGTPQQALAVEGLEVSTDGGRGDPELLGQAEHVDAAVLDHPVEDLAHSLGLHTLILDVHLGRNEQFRASNARGSCAA